MNDLISRQAAIDALDCINGTEEVLRSLPSAQPERKKGAWMDISCGTASLWKCSECGELFLEDFYYCPNCGAEMRGDANG